jgi:hypothetical protein
MADGVAEQRDELAPPHMGTPPRAWHAHYHTVAQERRCASQQKLRADVADGSSRRFQDARDMSDLPETRQGWAIYEYLP